MNEVDQIVIHIRALALKHHEATKEAQRQSDRTSAATCQYAAVVLQRLSEEIEQGKHKELVT